jgi:dGTPase
MISVMIGDLVTETQARLRTHKIETADDVRQIGQAMAGFSDQLAQQHSDIKAFLFERVYRHHTVNGSMSKARRVMRDLFDLLFAEPDVLPEEWRINAHNADALGRARIICDYIAGMTDRFAMEEHRRLFDISDSMA